MTEETSSESAIPQRIEGRMGPQGRTRQAEKRLASRKAKGEGKTMQRSRKSLLGLFHVIVRRIPTRPDEEGGRRKERREPRNFPTAPPTRRRYVTMNEGGSASTMANRCAEIIAPPRESRKFTWTGITASISRLRTELFIYSDPTRRMSERD